VQLLGRHETEFWDLIGNSDHTRYPAWHTKAKAYVEANADADPRLAMLVSAGAVFTLTTLFQHDDPLSELGDYAAYIDDATVGIHDAVAPLRDHEPALVRSVPTARLTASSSRSDSGSGSGSGGDSDSAWQRVDRHRPRRAERWLRACVAPC
jgi:hypothetical protein